MSVISQQIMRASTSTRTFLALALVAVALAIGVLMLPHDPGLTFLTLYPAVVVSFLLCGTWPGVLASAAATALGAWSLLPAVGSWPQAPGTTLAGIVFLAACGVIGTLSSRLTAALKASQDAQLQLAITAQAQAESERRYRILVEDQTEMVSLSDPDGRLTFVNHAYASHFGRNPAEMLGLSLFDNLPADSREAVREHLSAVCRCAGVARGENLMLAADGSGPRWVAWINRALVDADGRVTGIHSVGRDITEQKTLAVHLAAAAQEIADLYEHAPCGYHSVGANGTYIKINATELDWLGCQRSEVVGRLSPRDFLSPGDRDRLTTSFARARSSGEAQQLDCRLIGRHGVHRDVSIQMSVILDEDGSFLMTRSATFDISRQKTAERALTRLNHEQSLILDSELFGITRLRGRRFHWANSGLERMLGYASSELQDLPTRVVHLDDASYQAFGALAYPVLEQGGTFRGEVPMRTRDGTALWVEVAGTMLDGDSDESLWLFSDITARRRAEEELRSSRSLLERTGAAAGVGGWEYDLRTQALLWTDETRRIHGLPLDYHPDVEHAIAFYAPEAQPRIRAAIEAAIASGMGFDLELELIRADAKRIWVRAVGAVEFAEGVPVRLVGAFQDVSAKAEHVAHIKGLLALAEAQRTELSRYRDHAEAETDIARFLLSRLSRTEQLDAARVPYLWKPAEAFSGDIIAVANSSSGDCYGMLADATGHGLAAAINLIPLTSAFYAMASKGFNLVTIAEQLNKVVKDYSLADRFVAVTLARFQRREQQLEFVNAGNPAALLLDGQRRVLRELPSGSIPLGILDRPDFRPVAENIELHGDETLLMFSDGLVEACNFDGTPFGRAGIDESLRMASSTADLITALAEGLQIHAGMLPPADDVSVLVLDANLRPDLDGLDSGAEPALAHSDPLSSARAEGPDPHGDAPSRDCWSLDLSFSPGELRRMEPVPVIVDLCRSFHLGGEVESRMFTVLSELFQNALEHGLLGLDSALKSEPDGFERYLERRAQRLAALAQGEIAVRVEHRALDSGTQRVQIVVRDTGKGFDHVEHLARLTTASSADPLLLPSGRGIGLLYKLCDAVAFNASGNETRVEFGYG